jgi:hypothetical protein
MKISNWLGLFALGLVSLHSPQVLAQTGPGTGSGGGSSSSSSAPSCPAVTQQISLHIPNETVVPGGIVQMKFMVTTPTPISSGGPRIRPFAVGVGVRVRGINVLNPTGDVAGVALISSSMVSISYIASTGAQGPDYPIMTVALAIPTSTPVGTSMPFSLDPSSTWNLGFLGTASLKPMLPATITVGGSISITDIVPGGGLLPAGTAVSIQGIGFQPGSRVQLSGMSVASTSFISPSEIQFVLAQATEMSGKEIQVVNPDGSQATYFSYLRGIPLGQSNRALLSSALPIFSTRVLSSAVFASSVSLSANQFSGVALENSNLTPASVTFTLASADGTLATSSIVIPSGYRLMRETSEVSEGIAPPPGSFLTVSSNIPIQMFGFQGDDSTGTVWPFTPLSSQP